MIELSDVQNTRFESIPVDEFWNTSGVQEQKIHRIHSYPAKFPSFITTKALEYASINSVTVTDLADIFCGCGTTAYEAKRNQINFWGCDINPVATMIAKTKSKKYQAWRLHDYLRKIIKEYETTPILRHYQTANPRLKYWYKEDAYNSLYHLLETIEKVTNEYSDYQRFFICAFSNILKPSSVWLAKSIKPQVDPKKAPINILKAFTDHSSFMITATNQSKLTNEANTNIITANYLAENLTPPKVDMIVTSPPYVTSYEYADLHQLSTLWLRYTEDYRTFRNGSIGSSHQDFNLRKEWKRLNTTGENIVSRLIDAKSEKAKSVAKYYLDIQDVTKKACSMINNGGMALFVIGNTEFKGVVIDNAKHLSESLLSAGFTSVFATKRKISKKYLTPYRDAIGKFTNDSSGRLVYSEEFIIVGRK